MADAWVSLPLTGWFCGTLRERGSQASVGLVTQRHRCRTLPHNSRHRSWDLGGTSVLLPLLLTFYVFSFSQADLKLSFVTEAGLELLVLLSPHLLRTE